MRLIFLKAAGHKAWWVCQIFNRVKRISVYCYVCSNPNTSCLCYYTGGGWDQILHWTLRTAVWFIPQLWQTPVSTKTWVNPGINGDPLRKKDMKVFLSLYGCSLIRMHSYVPRWNRGLCVVIRSFHWYAYLMFFHFLPYLRLYALFTRTHQGGSGGGWEVCIRVWVSSPCVEECSVHMMNEIVRKRWIYGCECSHPSCPAVSGCPQGHRTPPGPILGGSRGIPLVLLCRGCLDHTGKCHTAPPPTAC